MSAIMRDVLREIREGNESIRDSMKKISNTFYNNSELSIQEACYNILQIPLSRSSEECVFIPTFPPDDRIKMLKSDSKLEDLSDDSTDIFEKGLLEHYIQRPISLNNETLAEFAANFRFSTSKTARALSLKDGSGFVTRRLTSRVIRYRNYQFEKEPEEFLCENIMLYVPWRHEQNDILNKNLEELYSFHEESIRDKRKMFNALDSNIMDTAMQDVEANLDNAGFVCEIDERQRFDFDEYTLEDNFTFADVSNELHDENQSNIVKFLAPGKIPESDFQELFEQLNQEQRDYIMHVLNHFETSDNQILHFLTGKFQHFVSSFFSILFYFSNTFSSFPFRRCWGWKIICD